MNPHTPKCLTQLGNPGAKCQCHALDRLADFAYRRAHPIQPVHTGQVQFAAPEAGGTSNGSDTPIGQPFGNRIAERAAADKQFARVMHDIVRGKSGRALRRLLRQADVIRTAPDLGPGNDMRGTPPERLQAGRQQVADKLKPGPTTAVQSSQPLDAPWSWMYPGVQEARSGSTPVNSRPHFTEYEADYVRRRDKAGKDAAQVRLSRSGHPQTTAGFREGMIARSLQGAHRSADWEGFQAARNDALKSSA